MLSFQFNIPRKEAIRVKAKKQKILEKRKENLVQRLALRGGAARLEPVLTPLNLCYEVSDRIRAIECGGIGVVHMLVQRVRLVETVNAQLHLFKRHLPYWESDHILHLSYNVLAGGTCLQDLEALRQDPAYLEVVGADRLPDPTTAGDFLRRFTSAEAVLDLQEAVNYVRRRVWRQQPAAFRQRAIVDVDGTHVATDGECKEGINFSHKGVWGYAPLVLSLDNSREVLYLVNRPGNAVSHDGAADWIDRAITLTKGTFKTVWLRGDTDFSLTAHFDRWDAQGVRFVFGLDAMPNLERLADALPSEAWTVLHRPSAYEVKTRPRKRPKRIKAEIVRQRGFKDLQLDWEEVATFPYRPTKCQKTYRVVVLRKHLRVMQGDTLVTEQIRYFFYITNDWQMTPAEVVRFSNDRCDQENHIEQLKNGVRALRCPGREFFANWAYMVIAALAWNLKAWYGLLMPDRQMGWQVVRMELKRFLHTFILFPCQILRAGRRLVLRLLQVTTYTQAILNTAAVMKHLKAP